MRATVLIKRVNTKSVDGGVGATELCLCALSVTRTFRWRLYTPNIKLVVYLLFTAFVQATSRRRVREREGGTCSLSLYLSQSHRCAPQALARKTFN